MPDTAVAKKCQKCGAEITNEQIAQRQAGLVQGVLLCPDCVEAKRKEAIEAHRAAAGVSGNSGIIRDITEEKISMVSDREMAGHSHHKIRSFSEGSTLGGAHHESKLSRPITGPNDPPTRIRCFHSKLTPGALAHMDDQINEWVDTHPDIYIKKVTTTVGPFEAKHVEQHLIVTIFY
jgi:hypothetical protein